MLDRMDKTSKVLQSKDVNILVGHILAVTSLLQSMKNYLEEIRGKLSECEFKARSVYPDTVMG